MTATADIKASVDLVNRVVQLQVQQGLELPRTFAVPIGALKAIVGNIMVAEAEWERKDLASAARVITT